MHDHERHHDSHQRRKRTIERAGPWRRPGDPCVGRQRWRPGRSAEGWQRVLLEDDLAGNAVPGLQPRPGFTPGVSSNRATQGQPFDARRGLSRR
jgi:hypothetical protein